MKAILIDPVAKTITEVDIDKSLETMYEVMDCSCITSAISFRNGDTMYCDDEGLFIEQKGGILMPNWAYMIVGKVLVVGTDEETGESIDVKASVDYFKKNIMWQSEDQVKKYQSHFI